ncbi:MAG: hypothetical protein IMZ46_20120 [Acidobacteria bacterium]|nr:hypothetical protein [Acidobacteriota bacterium]
MKKVLLMVLVVGLVAGLGSRQAFAQEKKVEFSLNLGVMTDLSSEGSFSEVLFTFAPQVDIHISPAFMISPEVMVITDDSFGFDPFLLYPGVILNYTSKGFFVGGGVVLPVIFWEGESDTGDLLPKINVGYRGNHFNLTAYLLTDTHEFLKYNLIGLGVGYRF